MFKMQNSFKISFKQFYDSKYIMMPNIFENAKFLESGIGNCEL